MAQAEIFNVTSTSHVLQFASFSFDASIPEICMPLMRGGTLYLAAQNMQPGTQMLEYLQKNAITLAALTPSVLAVLPEAELPALQTVIACGEACPAKIVARWAPGRHFFNVYGPTENTIGTTVAICQGDEKKPPIGRPLANVEVYILDTHLCPVPIGTAGELYIGGMDLARGYLNRPELTVERFIPHPFSTQPGARLYKTGDEVRYRPNGNIEFLGRLDSQVKIRGFRIELGEIEAVLSDHPEIREAVVVAREDVPGDPRLVAYVVPYEGKEERTLTNEALRQYLSIHLSAYMLPSTYVYLDALPLSPTDKVDRSALPAPASTRGAGTGAYVAPQQTLHHQLVQIWEELLTIHPIGIRDNFFEFGGHSLLAVRLMARIEEVCGKKLPLSALFEGATIEHLATALLAEAQDSSTRRTPISALNAGGTKPPFFFLHGDWQGKALYCLKLSQTLGEDQPFYILETYKYDGLKVLPSLKEVATAYIAAIRAIYPEGPYILGGWSNGALFAYEIAQQLRAMGQKVELLILMDPSSATIPSRLISGAVRWISSLLHLQQEQQLDWFLRLQHVYEYVRLWNDRKKQAAIQSRTEREGTPAEVEMAHPNFQWLLPSRENLRKHYIGIFIWWASFYKIEPYAGKVAVFFTKEGKGKERKDWGRILSGNEDVEVYMVPGTHITSRTKYIGSLAESLHACLSKIGRVSL
jgi:thioesterase domain-containing protein